MSKPRIIKGDFRIELNLPSYPGAQPLVLQHLEAEVGLGPELTQADVYSNFYNWNVGEIDLELNSSTGFLSIRSNNELDFETFDITISNIVFDKSAVVAGIKMLTNYLTDPIIEPTLSFDETGIRISYRSDDRFHFTFGLAEFQIYTICASFREAA